MFNLRIDHYFLFVLFVFCIGSFSKHPLIVSNDIDLIASIWCSFVDLASLLLLRPRISIVIVR